MRASAGNLKKKGRKERFKKKEKRKRLERERKHWEKEGLSQEDPLRSFFLLLHQKKRR